MSGQPEVAAGSATAVKRRNITAAILVSLLLGAAVGIIMNMVVPQGSAFDEYVVEDGLYLVGQAFIRLMQMLVVPLVFCSIVVGAASMSDPKMLGKVGVGTILMYLLTTAIAIVIALGLAELLRPGAGLDMGSIDTASYLEKAQSASASAGSTSVTDTLLNIIPTNIVGAMADGTMLQVIFFALVLGFILGRLGRRVATVNRFFTQFNAVMMRMVSAVLKVAPVGIFCLIARTFQNLGASGLLPLIKLIATVYLGLLIQLLVVYMLLLAIGARLNPVHFLRKFWPVMLFAFSTSSSNATIPLNLETLTKRMGVDPKVSSFTIPLGATINMDGTAIMQGVAVIFAAEAYGIDLGIVGILTVVLTAVIASVGTAGVPGVGTIMLTMVFNAVGLPVEGVAMIMGIDRVLDMGRTAINITGDAVVTTVMARWVGLFDRTVYEDDSVARIDPATVSRAQDPTDYDEYAEQGEPVEVGELGAPDRFEDVEVPELAARRSRAGGSDR